MIAVAGKEPRGRDEPLPSTGLGPLVPLFFGDTSGRLFGSYHAPLGGSAVGARNLGVVLCYPGPQEYRHAHWAYHKLATMLSRAGLHVLRFDYFATGDSAGESSEATLGRWIADVRSAAAELEDVAGVRRIALVGMRLGAAIAVRACADGRAFSDLVLWDPVVSGRAYLAQLQAAQARALRSLHYPASVYRQAGELLGYPMPADMREAIAGIDLVDEPYGKPQRVLVVCAEERAEFRALQNRLHSRGAACELHVARDPSLTQDYHWRADTLLAHAAPLAIVAHLTRRGP